MAGSAQRHPLTSTLVWLPLAALAVGLLVALTPLNHSLSRPLTDWQRRLAAPDQAPSGVVVLDIDDVSVDSLRPLLGSWPYRRDVYALVVEQLREAGARAVALDLLLADAQPGDTALAQTLARPGAPVVLAAAGLQPRLGNADDVGHGPTGAEPAAQAWRAFVLPASSTWPAPDQLPLLGLITAPLDDDGRLRQLALWHAASGQRLPALPLALWQALAPAGSQPNWPQDALGRVAVPFAGPPAQALELGFAQVVRPALGLENADALRQAVAGQVVFIGSSALLADTVMTVNGPAHGTAILAQTYAALRDGQLLRPCTSWAEAMLLALALLPALATWRRGRVLLPRDALAALLGLLAVLGAAAALLLGARMPTPWVAALATLATGMLLCMLQHQRQWRQSHLRLADERAVAAAANRPRARSWPMLATRSARR